MPDFVASVLECCDAVSMFPLFCPSVRKVHLSLSTLKFELIPYNSRQINAMCPKQNTSKQEWQVFLLI